MDKKIILGYGWKHLGGFDYYWPYNTELDAISNRPLSWRLNFVDTDKYLKLEVYERNSFEWEVAYMGPCENVHTFNYLMNLFLRPSNEIQDDLEIFKR